MPLLFLSSAPTLPFSVIVLFLVAGEKGIGEATGKPLHYKGTCFHRIIKGFMAQVSCLLWLFYT
jgi:cyclophilin family peptidyl-prolyl cis-trans isomerase